VLDGRPGVQSERLCQSYRMPVAWPRLVDEIQLAACSIACAYVRMDLVRRPSVRPSVRRPSVCHIDNRIERTYDCLNANVIDEKLVHDRS